MKFLVDICAGVSILKWLKERGHDILHVADQNPMMSDSDILDWALKEKRILITLDKDFQKLAFTVGKAHAGIIRLPNVERKRRVELIKIVLEQHAKDLGNSAIITVKPGNIRVTRTRL